jgi:hypothetical protein
MTEDKFAEVFDRGLRDGVDSLSDEDRELYRIRYFILGIEIDGLSGHLYNQLPDIGEIAATVDAMRNRGLDDLAGLFEQAASLFSGYTGHYANSTWNEVLREYDPENRLEELNHRITALDNYGLQR